MQRILNYIGGAHVEPAGGAYLETIEPATGVAYCEVPDSDERDVELAVAAAKQAFPSWSSTPAFERAALLLEIAEMIEDNLDDLARAESIDNGKPVHIARAVDIPRAALNFRFFATAILHESSESHASDDQAINYTLRKPRGVAGLISPWNLPLYLFTWKIAPAIATGNTAVAKPSEVTPMTAHLLTEICHAAGMPNGVLNVVHGLGAKVGAPLTAHRDVPTLSFTGGTATGREIAKTAAPMFKKVSLEMGGKNPTVVFADCDFETTVREAVRASFSNQGQICLCGSRIFVERPIYEKFVDAFVAQTSQLTIGDPLEQTEQVNQGALVSKAQLEKVQSYVALAREEGGEIVCGGEVPEPVSERCKGGYFFQPTVITGLSYDCRVNTEEIFGPVVTIMPFDDEAQVIDYANATDYGLAASIWTRDTSRAHRVAHRIQSGTVWVNCWMIRDLRVPFGGMKQSGLGREGGEEALRFFTEPKNVCVRL